MSFFSDIRKDINSMFQSYVEVTNANGIEINPISKALENMNTRPKYKTIDKIEYLTFGKNDDVDLMIDKLMYKSPTHSGIVTKKAKMIAGKGLQVNSELIGTKNTRLNAIIRHAGGANISLFKLISEAAFEYTKAGSFGIIVDFGVTKAGKKVPEGIVKLQVVPSRHLRFQKPSEAGDYTHIVYKQSFKSGADVLPAEVIPIFNPFKKDKRAIIYVKSPYGVLDSYGVPNWIGAFHFIEADYEFGIQIENSAKNGFAPKTHVTMIGRNMSKDERRLAASNIQGRLSGSRGDQVVVSFVSRESEKPLIDTIQGSNLDRTIEIMSRLNDNKILTAHNITSPSLFGVMTTGQVMGGTGTEMTAAYKLFKATETIPDRKIILDAFKMAFEVTELANIELEIVEEDIEVEFKTKPVEGGNTKDNPDIKDTSNKPKANTNE